MTFVNGHAVRSAFGVMAAGALLHALGCSKNPAPETTAEVSTGTVAPSVSGAMSAAAPLLNQLTAGVPGLSQAQAVLGAGAALGLAKAKMPADQYAQVASAVPGSDVLVNEAAKQGMPSNPTGLSSLTDFLGKAGISPAQFSQLVPVMGETIKKVSPDAANAFLAALR